MSGEDWRPYTVPYTGSGAVYEGNNRWVSSSGNTHPVVAYPPPRHGDRESTCGAPMTGEDREATAARDEPSSSGSGGSSQHDKDQPHIPCLARRDNMAPAPMTNIPHRFKSSHGSLSSRDATYGDPTPMIRENDGSPGRKKSAGTVRLAPEKAQGKNHKGDDDWVFVDSAERLNHPA